MELSLLSEKFSKLSYYKNDELNPIPKWINFYLQIGLKLSSFNSSDKSFVFSIIVPSLPFVSSLISIGMILGKFSSGDTETDDQKFNYFYHLPEESIVYVLEGNRKLKGVIKGKLIVNNTPHINIQLDEGKTNTIKSFSKRSIHKLFESDKVAISLPKNQNGRIITDKSELIEGIFGLARSTDYIFNSQFINLHISNKNRLLLETESELAILMNALLYKSPIDQILRMQNLNYIDKPFRTKLLTSRFSTNELIFKELGTSNPFAVIFDDPLGYIKNQSLFQNHNQVIILDINSPHLLEATSIISSRYLYRTKEPMTNNVNDTIPGVELLHFLVDKQ